MITGWFGAACFIFGLIFHIDINNRVICKHFLLIICKNRVVINYTVFGQQVNILYLV